MLRHPALRPLSSEHHLALVRAQEARLAAASGDPRAVQEAFRNLRRWAALTLGQHMYAEESLLIPPLARLGAHESIQRLREEHATLVHLLRPESDGPAALERLGELLAAHVRFEENELFPWLEQRLSVEELEAVGDGLHAREAGAPG